MPRETSSRATKSPEPLRYLPNRYRQRPPPSARGAEDVHGDERKDCQQREHEEVVRGHLVETKVLLVDVDGQSVRLPRDAAETTATAPYSPSARAVVRTTP